MIIIIINFIDFKANLSQSACLLLRVDDICSAKAARQGGGAPGGED